MIEGKQIILRTITSADLEEVFNLLSNIKEKGTFWSLLLPSDPLHRQKFNETGFWDGIYGRLLIAEKNGSTSGRLLGEICYFQNAPYRAGYEIGYQLYRQEYRGKGIMTEALRLFSSYLFELWPIPRLQITCMQGNIPSRRVAEKCGFKFEGVLRQATFNRGHYYDLELFSLLREECPSFSAALKL